jgi:ubiquinone/menaquinone biosynthesis C-methylase UbiE
MPKQGEIDYLKNIGDEGTKHALNKPFSDDDCGGYLMELGAIMSLLPPPPARLLDLGCGTGWTSCFFAKRGYEVIGQDISAYMITQAEINKKIWRTENLHFVVSDYENMNFDSEFDCAVFFDALHHAVNEEAAIRMVYKALKPGGICVTSEPGMGHRKSRSSTEAIKNYNVTEKDMPPLKIKRIGKKTGFRIFRIYPHSKHLNIAIYRNIGKIARFSFINKFLKFNLIRNLAAIFLIIFYKKYEGIVLMVK